MKKTLISSLAVATAVAAPAAYAVELNGASMDLGYSAFTDESDVNKTAIEGSVELGFSPNIAAQIDLGATKFGLSNEDNINAAVHGIYHLDDATAFGAFAGVDRAGGEDNSFYGLEAAYDTGAYETEGYVQFGEYGSEDFWGAGGSVRYAVNASFGLGASYDYADVDNAFNAQRFAAVADYNVSDSTRLYAELGVLDSDDLGLDTEPFIGAGVKVSLGGGEPTFGSRGLVGLIPGL
ncbi:hypothetical protein PSA7680_01699 [Pseudoruegeria aquimaris]|uniref:Porin domain-containing protein n=1 Tax=Pseudoruegeria aquimaris TaxID=393663 RepID=A0A1Y5S9U7_9RHOB|nr:porin [Pseudoruegeria aquimaris]SLN35864.1 hypothetical protein PSA7680_01699 [Pseudoruegeria aquimaris]